MRFEVLGDNRRPAVLFFHAMGVTGSSSRPVAQYLRNRFFCILPTSTAYCEGQRYAGKEDDFIAAGRALRYGNLRRQLADSLEDKPFPPLTGALQSRGYFTFGSAEDHFKYRDTVMRAYPCGHFPVFEGHRHMEYQIRDPQGFADMLASIAENGCMPELPFVRE